MVARNRLPPWHEEIRLGNGREVLVRPIRPDDAPVLRAGLELLQPDDIRRHLAACAGAGDAGGDALADRLGQPDARREFTLVVTEQLPPGEAVILALACARIVADSDEAAFSILTARNVAGLGLGRHLLRRVSRWAAGKGVEALRGDVPEANGPLLDLARSMGFEEVEGADPGFIRIRLPLAAATPVAAARARA